ncbi:MAG TPA: cupredoxin domain-containing protein [Burkholderiales bacterium]|nr:cupredoxin domain-containing protein [Burkholderiales bacterium]
MNRRLFLLLPLAGAAWAQPEPRVIAIRAKKFEYMPAEIELKAGEPVVLELTTEDVHMGFDAPELGLHADIIPGRVVRVPFTPGKPGSFEFACDVFCGSGHEDMTGVIKVAA